MRFLIVLILMWISSSAFGGWDVMVFPEDSKSNSPGASIIAYIDGPQAEHKDFRAAISEIDSAGRASELKHVTLHALVPTEHFQKQLLATLKEQASEQLTEAMESSGNLHNPALRPLMDVLSGAVLTLPIVQDIAGELAGAGLKVSDASFEKFFLHKEESGTKILFFLWLSVEPA